MHRSLVKHLPIHKASARLGNLGIHDLAVYTIWTWSTCQIKSFISNKLPKITFDAAIFLSNDIVYHVLWPPGQYLIHYCIPHVNSLRKCSLIKEKLSDFPSINSSFRNMTVCLRVSDKYISLLLTQSLWKSVKSSQPSGQLILWLRMFASLCLWLLVSLTVFLQFLCSETYFF